MLRLTTDLSAEDDGAVADEDRALAESLQDRLRRDEQTARALRAYIVEHGVRG